MRAVDYSQFKIVHMGLALASVCGFVLRWIWLNSDSALFEQKLTRILPHIIDTLFLASGIWLAVIIRQYPFAHGWLTAKIFGLLAYIILGSLALKKANSQLVRTLAFGTALLSFAWIASVARSKTATGFFSLLFDAPS